jgi:protein tyrosine phosphatase (PTP) superfamily phosphohydrolase (DUF442 family)
MKYILLSLLLIACASERSNPIAKVEVGGNFSEGSLKSIEAKKQTVVINLRSFDDKDYSSQDEKNERTLLTEKGISYYHVPMSPKQISQGVMDVQTLAKVANLIETNQGRNILVHCASKNRAAAAVAWYSGLKQDLQDEEILKLAKELGMTKEDIREALKNVLKAEAAVR